MSVVEPSSSEPRRCSALGVILNRYKPETGLGVVGGGVGVLHYKVEGGLRTGFRNEGLQLGKGETIGGAQNGGW